MMMMWTGSRDFGRPSWDTGSFKDEVVALSLWWLGSALLTVSGWEVCVMNTCCWPVSEGSGTVRLGDT